MKPTQLELPFEGDADSPALAEPPTGAASQPLPCQSAALPAVPEPNTARFLAEELRQFLIQTAGVDIRLRITNNSSTMMTLRYEQAGGRAVVGLHHMFLDAPEAIRKALGTWIVQPRRKSAGKKLEAFIAERRHLIVSRPPRRLVLRTEGRHFDLKTLYDGVNEEEFDGTVTTPITWGKMPTRQRRRSIRFGSYTPSDDLIRIHPYLDQAFVPAYFVRYIVFHEMLHAHMGIEEGPTGRRRIHPPAFREREAQYPDYERAVAWLEDEANLQQLLRAPRK